MILETLDIKVGDKLIYSENTFDLDNNFKMILKDENPKSVRSIHYNDVGRYILDSTPKSLMVYRLLTNVDGIKGDMIKYGFLVYINGVREAIYFDPIFAIKEIEDIGYLYEDNLRFRIQQLGLMSSISIKNECTYSEVYSFDLEPDEVHGQNDRVFAEAIFAFDSVDFDSVQGVTTPKRDWNHIGNFSESKKVNVAQDPNYDPLRTTRLKVVTSVTPNQFQPQQTKSTEESGRIRFLGHDEQGAETALKRGMALHLSNAELDRLKLIIQQHMRVHAHSSRQAGGQEMSRKAIYRFFRDCGEAGIDLILLALADTRATYDQTLTQEHWAVTLDVCRTLLEAWFEKAEEIVRPVPLLNGDDLINELKLKPGPEIGKLLEAIRETQATGNLSSREAALAFARGWLVKAREK